MSEKKIKKIVLAYSGGLDTSVIIPWLKENYDDPEIIAVAGNVGQADELDGLQEKALKTGASKLYVEDLTDEFVNELIIPSVQAGAKYEEYSSALHLHVPLSVSVLPRSPSQRAPTRYVTDARVKATTRCASSLR